jgi:hypothetical protein
MGLQRHHISLSQLGRVGVTRWEDTSCTHTYSRFTRGSGCQAFSCQLQSKRQENHSYKLCTVLVCCVYASASELLKLSDRKCHAPRLSIPTPGGKTQWESLRCYLQPSRLQMSHIHSKVRSLTLDWICLQTSHPSLQYRLHVPIWVPTSDFEDVSSRAWQWRIRNPLGKWASKSKGYAHSHHEWMLHTQADIFA